MMDPSPPTVHLKPKAHTRLKRGHLWVFSNEIDHIEGEVQAGCEVRVVDSAGRHRGTGTHNPHTLISVRLHGRGKESLDADLIQSRLVRAVERRRALYPQRQCWRAVFSEADGLPGLIVDRFASIAVIQILSAGMEQRRDLVIQAVIDVLECKGIFERSDSAQRTLEGLESRVGTAWGEVPEFLSVEDPEGVSIEVPLATGQKTGLFLDHHDSRILLRGRAEGAKVLDAFCYVGQWSCCAARWGAEAVLGIDASGEAVAQAEANALRNGVGEKCRFAKGDIFDELRRLEKERERFDVIVLDPPAFAKSRRQVRDALRGYREINLRAMRCLAKGGLLFTASCSHHVSEADFREMLVQAASSAGREFVVEASLRQSGDHPILLGHPETSYLKGALLRLAR